MDPIKGIAIILFGIIVSIGAVFEFVYCWYAGLVIGFIGLIIVLKTRKESSNEKIK